MHSPISRDDLQILLHEATLRHRRLTRQLRLLRAELDDVRQDLLVDLIARLPPTTRIAARSEPSPASCSGTRRPGLPPRSTANASSMARCRCPSMSWCPTAMA
jgi:hypothetical protein